MATFVSGALMNATPDRMTQVRYIYDKLTSSERRSWDSAVSSKNMTNLLNLIRSVAIRERYYKPFGDSSFTSLRARLGSAGLRVLDTAVSQKRPFDALRVIADNEDTLAAASAALSAAFSPTERGRLVSLMTASEKSAYDAAVSRRDDTAILAALQATSTRLAGMSPTERASYVSTSRVSPTVGAGPVLSTVASRITSGGPSKLYGEELQVSTTSETMPTTVVDESFAQFQESAPGDQVPADQLPADLTAAAPAESGISPLVLVGGAAAVATLAFFAYRRYSARA